MTMQDDWKIIHVYTRKQAIADGVLVDVTETAKEAGFRIPVALTQAVWAEYVAVAEGLGCQDEAGRLWDVLWMFRHHKNLHRAGPTVRFRLYVKKHDTPGGLALVTLKGMCGPADDGSPCITIMLPDED